MIRLALAICLIGGGASAQVQCADDSVLISGDFGQARFRIEIADDAAERGRGLMEREGMATMAGMLFIYPEPINATFWMKDTYIPLDMLFVDSQGVISRIHANAEPLDLSVIQGGDGVLAVLEINGGMAERLGIAEGDVLMHPSFGPDAAMPCP